MALLSNEDSEVRALAGEGLGYLAAGICLHLEKAQEKDQVHVQEEDEQEQQKQAQEIQEIKEQA